MKNEIKTEKKIEARISQLIDLGRNIHIIVLTGGPCSGKTTGLERIKVALKDKGYKVIISPESSTKLISAGVCPWEIDAEIFQRQILLDTLMQEERMIESAITYRDLGYKVVILCDRGAMDGQAYMQREKFHSMLGGLGLSSHTLTNGRYHAVIHLNTTALGAEKFYTLENNSARKECPELAREIDKKTFEAWEAHNHLRVIDNSTGFDEKVSRLISEVYRIIGYPQPLEIESKFLIKFREGDESGFSSPMNSSEIVQDYLIEEISGEERRVRARDYGSEKAYFYTVKRGMSRGVRSEVERVIDKAEYDRLLLSRDSTLKTIRKKRSTFFWSGRAFEVDVYESPRLEEGHAIMEVEKSSVLEQVNLPPWIEIIREVTDDSKFSNFALAKR